MNQKIKITNKTSIEVLKKCSDSNDLELVGICELSCCSQAFKNAVESKYINEDCCFNKNFDDDCSFFYFIEAVKNGSIVYYERGIASIYSKDGRTFLNRHTPLVYGENSNKAVVIKDGIGFPFNYNDDTKLVLYSTVPHSFLECLALDHSIIGCSDPFFARPIQLEQNSILARFDDDIEGVGLDDNRLIDKLINAFAKFTKQIKLKTSKLSLKRLECETIDLLSTSNIKAKKGSLYYDESDDTIKVYNGNEWKTIAFVKD
jgi:hypothetical protein